MIILLFLLDMLAHSPKDRSRSPHRTNGTTVNSSSKHSSNQNETTSQNDMSSNDTNTINNNSTKTKKENESQLRMKSLKVRIIKNKKINLTYLFFFSVIYSNINK